MGAKLSITNHLDVPVLVEICTLGEGVFVQSGVVQASKSHQFHELGGLYTVKFSICRLGETVKVIQSVQVQGAPTIVLTASCIFGPHNGITEGSKEEPSITGGSKEEPSITEGSKEEPSITEGSKEEPSIAGGSKEEPSITEGSKEEPSIAGGSKEEPSITGGSKEEPKNEVFGGKQDGKSQKKHEKPEVKNSRELAIFSLHDLVPNHAKDFMALLVFGPLMMILVYVIFRQRQRIQYYKELARAC